MDPALFYYTVGLEVTILTEASLRMSFSIRPGEDFLALNFIVAPGTV
jgi:hypothetical protein